MAAAELQAAYEAVDALNRRDLDAFVAFYHPEAEGKPTREFAGVDQPAYRGPEENREIVQSMIDAMDFRVELQEALFDGRRGMLSMHWLGRGRASGVDVERTVYMTVEVEDGRAKQLVSYTDRDEALAAAQLPPELTARVALQYGAMDAHNAGDYAAMVEMFHEDAEWHTSESFAAVGGDVRRGPAEIRRLAETVAELFEEYWWEVEELIAFDELVVAGVRWHGRGGASGATVERTITCVFEFRGAKVARVRTFDARAEALAAAGLPELPR